MEKPWSKSWPKGVPESISYPEIPLFELLRNTAKKYPKKEAIIFYDKKITYKELDTLSDKFATALADMGVKKGDRVALFLANCPQYVISFFGGLKAGATLVPCNPMYKERELEHQLNDSGAETIVALGSIYKVVKNVREKTGLKNIIVTGIEDYMPLKGLATIIPRVSTMVSLYPDTINFLEMMDKYEPKPPEIEINPKEDLAVLQYTGGTTGVPKGAMLTHYNIMTNAIQVAHWSYSTEGKDVTMSVLPLFHIYGLTITMILPTYRAGTIILIPRFDLETVLKAVEKYKPNYFPGVPTMYVSLNEYSDIKKYKLSSIRYCVSGAAPLPFEVMKTFEELTGANLVEGYGLTEASPTTHSNPMDKRDKKRVGSIGIPYPDTDAKIVDVETGTKDIPLGETGELVIRGPQVMKGYWNKPEETEKTLRDGWLYTGDIAKMDEDGYFYIVDRKKDMIDVSGFKVWPTNVEDVLYEHPAVEEAAVIGVPHPYRGETVKAYIVLKAGYSGKVTEEDIINFCRERIAAYKVPRIVEFRMQLPKTLVGKILRKDLKEEERWRAKAEEK